MLLAILPKNINAGNRITIYNISERRVVYENPDGAKPYPHLHFYKNKAPFYCLRLDNLEPCDGTGRNKNKVPK